MIGALVAGITGSGGASLSSYESIATQNGTGSSGTITFSSIPSTFKHLQIRGIFNDGGYNLNLRANSDSGSNYSRHIITTDGTTISAAGAATQTSIDTGIYGGSGANNMSSIIVDILDYGSSTKNKTFRVFGSYTDGTTDYRLWVSSGLWMSTSAITSVSILNLYGNYATTSTFALYGIKEA